jgi:hypothetical protein
MPLDDLYGMVTASFDALSKFYSKKSKMRDVDLL